MPFSNFSSFDHEMMLVALQQAQLAADCDEVPVGAVLTVNNQIVACGYNKPIMKHDPTAHAEMQALRKACCNLNNYRLPKNSCLYVTLEPCTMCLGALIHARLSRLVFAASEPKAGAVISKARLLDNNFYNHTIEYQHGLFANKSSEMLSQFFKNKRRRSKKGSALIVHTNTH